MVLKESHILNPSGIILYGCKISVAWVSTVVSILVSCRLPSCGYDKYNQVHWQHQTIRWILEQFSWIWITKLFAELLIQVAQFLCLEVASLLSHHLVLVISIWKDRYILVLLRQVISAYHFVKSKHQELLLSMSMSKVESNTSQKNTIIRNVA